MVAWMIGLSVIGCGALGGLINAVLAGDLKLPHRDATGTLYSPGWIGNVAIGAVAALVYWGLYGPLAKMVIIGGSGDIHATFTLAELAGSVVTGIGGGRILSNEVDKKALTKSRDQLVDKLAKRLPE